MPRKRHRLNCQGQGYGNWHHFRYHSQTFEKFVTTSEGGIGLGPFISKSIIDAHGGMIWADNNTGERGATFSFVIPMRAVQEIILNNCGRWNLSLYRQLNLESKPGRSTVIRSVCHENSLTNPVWVILRFMLSQLLNVGNRSLHFSHFHWFALACSYLLYNSEPVCALVLSLLKLIGL